MIVWIWYWLHWNRRGRNIKYVIIVIKDNVYTEQVDALLRHQSWLKHPLCLYQPLQMDSSQVSLPSYSLSIRCEISSRICLHTNIWLYIQVKCHLNLLSIRMKVHAGFFYHTEIAHTVWIAQSRLSSMSFLCETSRCV